MKILTFNLWHGISPGGAFLFRTLEPEPRRLERASLQTELLKSVAADVAFLQEVNPVGVRAEQLGSALGRKAFYHGDIMGLKWMGRGFPPKFNSGLATLVDPKFSPRLEENLKLSGSAWSIEETWLSVQWSESRYAVLTEMLHPRWGRTLVVNAHLHHGVELTVELNGQIDQLVTDGALTPIAGSELRERLTEGNARRKAEVQALLARIEKLRSRYSMILLGGDFNFTPESEAYHMLTSAGFCDLWRVSQQSPNGGATFDGDVNFANHIFTRQFPPTVEWKDLSFSPITRERLTEIITLHENRSRRIDYLFARPVSGEVSVRQCQLVGLPEGERMAPSDHFGVLAEIDWQV